MDRNLGSSIANKIDDVHQDIAFIGSRAQFPDSLLRLVDFEITNGSVIRFDNPAAVRERLFDPPVLAGLIVVHEALWDQIDLGTVQEMQQNGSMVAIAYRDPERVIPILKSEDPRLRGIGFLPTELNIDSMLTILRLLQTGYAFVANDLLKEVGLFAALAPALDAAPAPQPLESQNDTLRDNGSSQLRKLTPREREVLALVADGLQNKHIANELSLSEHTVKLHLHHVISKLGARNRTDAAMRFRKENSV